MRWREKLNEDGWVLALEIAEWHDCSVITRDQVLSQCISVPLLWCQCSNADLHQLSLCTCKRTVLRHFPSAEHFVTKRNPPSSNPGFSQHHCFQRNDSHMLHPTFHQEWLTGDLSRRSTIPEGMVKSLLTQPCSTVMPTGNPTAKDDWVDLKQG